MTRVAFFDTKPYDRRFFEPRLSSAIAPTWIEAHLRKETAALAGIVGLGKIGKALASILLGFGMKVLATDKLVDPHAAGRVELVPLETLLAQADVVSLHAPLAPDTQHLIDERRIALMKPGVVLINTSRGGLVSAKALITGLKSGHIGAAGLDVYEEESEYFFEDRSDRAIADDVLARLMTFPNVLITSHQGFFTEEALAQIAATTAGNIESFLGGARGAALTNVVMSPMQADVAGR